MIPKIIHYCWFGKKEKPRKVKKCIESWKRNLIGYEIIEWNESNFDITYNRFVEKCYMDKNFAFVSDYVRISALYRYGGIYLDTDVEVLKNFDNFLDNESFWGFEEKNYIATSTIGCEKGNKLIKEFLDYYDSGNQINLDGSIESVTNVYMVTKIFQERGLILNNKTQLIKGVGRIYPQEYFSPYDYINCYNKKSKNTVTIHYFYKSWLPKNEILKQNIKKIISFLTFGMGILVLRRMISYVRRT